MIKNLFKMAAFPSGGSPEDARKKTMISRALNQLSLLNMHNISSQQNLHDIV